MLISFYHLTKSPMDNALPKLFEKIVKAGNRALFYDQNKEKVDNLNNRLWSYTTKYFLPHGTEEDGFVEDQPVFLTTKLQNPNKATILVVNDADYLTDYSGFERALYMFDGNEESELSKARQLWKKLKSENLDLKYYKQDTKGNWVENG